MRQTGGIYNYIDSLNKILNVINDGINKKQDLVNWLIDSFENVTSEKTSWGYITVPKNMGLINFNDGICYLTDAGNTYLESNDLEFLYQTISKNILAFDDIYQFLKSVSTPQTQQQILDFLKGNFDIEWTTFAQVNFRVLWLENLKKIGNNSQGYFVF